MTDSEVFDMIADKELMERTVRCTDVAHPRHTQMGCLLSANNTTNKDGSGCVCYVGFATYPTHAGSTIPVRKVAPIEFSGSANGLRLE